MTRRWLCIVLAAFCCLLALATSAHAECAWVLWLQRGSEWGIVKAFAGLADCETLHNTLDGAIRPENKGRFTYICLPDTVDPRGPKGK